MPVPRSDCEVFQYDIGSVRCEMKIGARTLLPSELPRADDR